MLNNCYEVSVRFSKDSLGAEEALRRVFLILGFDEGAVISLMEQRYSYLKVYCNTQKESQVLVKRLKDFHLKKIAVDIKKLGVSDWRDKWKEEIKPFKLTKKFDVVPLWKVAEYDQKNREPIFLDTTLAFGTGLHETTRFTSQLIEKYAGKIRSFLDVGTGTGLLAIVASKCGASELWAVDIDESSIRTAQQNCACNEVALDWSRAIDFRKFRHKKQFDFVAANVITDELIDMRHKIVSTVKPGKYLALSGISLKNLSRLKKAFSDQPLRCLRVLKGKKWSAVLYKKVTDTFLEADK